MVIRGNSRSNARQLSRYLLTMKDNEAIRILDVDGQEDAQAEDLHRAVFAMGISAELSKSEKGLYHAQINPAIGEDQTMSDERWLEAGDILGKQLGLENQRRAIVLHVKKGRTHAHVVWERYDHEKEKMVSDSFSRLAQDRARKEMEAAFAHTPTPHRNKHRPELKASLTQLWNQTGTGAQFVKAARQNGYIIGEGSGRAPYIVVDAFARSYDLTRQLQGVRLKDVRQRLRGESLMGEKDAITLARKAANENTGSGGTGKQQSSSSTLKPKSMSKEFKDNAGDVTGSSKSGKPTPGNATKEAFAQNKTDMTQKAGQPQAQANPKADFAANKQQVTGQQPKPTVKEQFADNKKDIGGEAKGKETDKRREEFQQRMKEQKEKAALQKGKNKGPEMG